MKKFIQIPLLLLFCVSALCSSSQSSSLPPTDASYDAIFERYWSRYLPHLDYYWGNAQCYQESLFDPRARSHAGAMGLCQFMPGTHRECIKALRLSKRASPYDYRISILCNAWYMQRLNRTWKSPRSDLERLTLAQASYNAGAGNIIRAQSKCQMAPLWQSIQPCLQEVTGIHSEETTTYVQRISRWYKEIKDDRNVLRIEVDPPSVRRECGPRILCRH